MAKTLADMAAEERTECVGMWCSIAGAGRLCVLLSTENDMANLGFSHDNEFTMLSPLKYKNVTPRFDLPRAWMPCGLPVPGEWEDGHVFVSYDEPDPWITKDTVSIEGLSEGGMSYYEEPPNGIVVKLDRFGEGEGKARRWVGEWEQGND